MPKSYHSPWDQAILSDPDLAETLKLTMSGPDPQPDPPEYKSFNRWENECTLWYVSTKNEELITLDGDYRVATPFGGFDKAPRGITFKLPELDLNPPRYHELQEPGVKRPTFNRMAQGWISEGAPLILPTVTVEAVNIPESDDL